MLERRLLEIPHRIMRIVHHRRNAGTILMFSGNGVAKQCIAALQPVFERLAPRCKLALLCGQFLFLGRIEVELTMNQGVEFSPAMVRCGLKHASQPYPDQRERNDQPCRQGDTTKVHS